jgi:hypothetical protein
MSVPRARLAFEEVRSMYRETDARVLDVLERALRSASRSTRLRAVAMLSRVECDRRYEWLADAGVDPDSAVRETACIVSAWTAGEPALGFPEREDPRFDAPALFDVDAAAHDAHARFRWQWEYALEVWRDDGLLVGVYLATTCEEDDEHAKRIALGQAILASAAPRGDRFDPASAAAFIVGKRRVRSDPRSGRAP